MSKLNLTRIGFLLKNRRVESGLSIRELSIKSGLLRGRSARLKQVKLPRISSVYIPYAKL